MSGFFVTLQTLSNLSGNLQEVAKHPGQVWDALKQPYADAINSDHPGEAFGRGFVDIGSFFVPGGAIGKAGEGANVLSKVSKVGDVTNTLSKVDKAGTTVSRATNVAGVAENGITKAKDLSKLTQVVKDARVPKTHITYTLRDSDGVVRYVGRASGKGTPQEVLEKRLALDKGSKKHHIIKEHGEELKGGEARLEGVHGNKAAAEGGEDVLYSRYQIRGKDVPKVIGDKEVIKHELTVKQKGGRKVTMGGGANNSEGSKILLNRQNPVSENSSKIRNPFTFGAKSSDKVTKDSGFEKIKAYAEELRKESVFGRVEYLRKID